MEFDPKWELICGDTYRMKTPEGWLVKDSYHAILADKSTSVSLALERVLDPDHVWEFKR